MGRKILAIIVAFIVATVIMMIVEMLNSFQITPPGPDVINDPVNDWRRVCHALIFTAVFSRHLFVWLSFGQTTVDVIAGCEAAWRFFDGVFKVVIPDNLAVPRHKHVVQSLLERFLRTVPELLSGTPTMADIEPQFTIRDPDFFLRGYVSPG